jgi:hypothetical protein
MPEQRVFVPNSDSTQAKRASLNRMQFQGNAGRKDKWLESGHHNLRTIAATRPTISASTPLRKRTGSSKPSAKG